MHIKIKKVILHNFLSYGHAEFELEGKHYCLVSGVNNDKRDNATSNGSGKCFGAGTKVLMQDGTQKNVEDITVGDFVIGWDSTPRKVLETHTGKAPMYLIKGHFGNNADYSYTCNGEHLLVLKKTCGNASKKDPIGNITEISVNDYLRKSKTWKMYHNQFITAGVNYKSTSILRIPPYILGLWLGDGNKRNGGLTSADQELIDAWTSYAKNLGMDYSVTKFSEICSLYNIVPLDHVARYNGNKFNGLLRSYDLLDNKHIPLEYLTASKEDRLQLLAGLIDTDGWLQSDEPYHQNKSGRSGYYCITQKSETLSANIAQLAMSLGFKTSTKRYLDKKYNTYYTTVSITGDVWNIPVRLDRKKAKIRPLQRPRTLNFDIVSIGDNNYYGFTIEGDGKFLLGNGIIVHNSSWGSAISWALTGETIQGISSGIKNINIDEDSCYVELYFSVDNDEYKITRYKNPKSDLKIIVNGNDVSGKGIRESEAILNKYIPDLTSQLIGSIIILGQGLPYKFSNNTPSGRKAILEKLSKSDFMIQDLKDRINERSKVLSLQLREVEDELLTKTSNKTLLTTQIENQELVIKELSEPRDFDSELAAATLKLNEINAANQKIKKQIADNEVKSAEKNLLLNEKNAEKAKALAAENTEFNSFKASYFEKRATLNSQILALTHQINHLKSITDVCPTCGQHIPNVVKHSTEIEEKELAELNNELAEIDKKNTSFETIHKYDLEQIEKTYNAETAALLNELRIIKQEIDFARKQDAEHNQSIVNINTQINKINLEKTQHLNNLQNAKNILYNLNHSVSKLDNEILYNVNEKDNISKHISVINQMNTLIKRDFRGYLLNNVISYIALKVKEYSIEIFGTDLLKFTLDGNNINISYCDKPFENLSGGEKQRTDLIIQFAIRDMMRQYLNFSSNILLLDEIFDSLDATAVDAVLKCICNKLVDVDSLFIISHHAKQLEIPYDSELIITKDELGISNINWG